jgi:hypothetical protein
LNQLGPLAALAGTWEGDEGIDVSPAPGGSVETRFRERLTLDPLGPVKNGPQTLYGLRYATTAWPLGEADPFHEEVGYWLWDAAAGQVYRCFMVPRGVTVLASGEAAADAESLELRAEVGSETTGILSNPVLAPRMRTVAYELRLSVNADGSFSYEEDTHLERPDQPLFHHTDSNRLARAE